jgi:hypothetical protein
MATATLASQQCHQLTMTKAEALITRRDVSVVGGAAVLCYHVATAHCQGELKGWVAVWLREPLLYEYPGAKFLGEPGSHSLEYRAVLQVHGPLESGAR